MGGGCVGCLRAPTRDRPALDWGRAENQMTAVLTSIAPQFLVDDLARSIEYYCRCLGFALDFNYEGFYASVSRDGCAIHLKGGAEDRGRPGASQTARTSRCIHCL